MAVVSNLSVNQNYPRILCFRIAVRITVLLLFVALFTSSLSAQCTRKVRRYATVQKTNAGLLTWVTNPGNAVDGDVKTYSELTRVLGVGGLITVTQFLQFPNPIPAGTELIVKMKFPTSILSVLGGVEVQPFTGLNENVLLGWRATAAGRSWGDAELLSLLNGAGDMEVKVVPAKTDGTPVAYEGVWIRLAGVAVGQTLPVYHAYVLEDAVGNLDCDKPIDVLAGVRAGTAVGGIASATGSITGSTDPLGTNDTGKWEAIDDDPELKTYAQLNLGVQVLSEVFHTTIFNTPSEAGDTVRLALQNSVPSLLSLELLTGFSVQAYMGKTPVGAPITSAANFLSLSLLKPADQIYELKVPVNAGSFDRVEIRMGGVVGALSSLRIYNVSRIMKSPEMSVKLNSVSFSGPLCSDQLGGLRFSVQPENCTSYTWLNADGTPAVGTLSDGGTVFTPTITQAGIYTFRVKASRTGCISSTAESSLGEETGPLTVLERPSNPVITISQ